MTSAESVAAAKLRAQGVAAIDTAVSVAGTASVGGGGGGGDDGGGDGLHREGTGGDSIIWRGDVSATGSVGSNVGSKDAGTGVGTGIGRSDLDLGLGLENKEVLALCLSPVHGDRAGAVAVDVNKPSRDEVEGAQSPRMQLEG